MRMFYRLTISMLLLGLTANLGACGRSLPLDDGDVVVIRVRPEAPDMYIGQIVQLSVEAHLADGRVMDVSNSPELLLRLSKSGLVRLLEGGRLIADNAGQVQLLAAYGGKQDRVDIEVRYAVLEGISVEPDSHQMPVGDVLQLSVQGHLSDNSSIDLSQAASGTTYESRRPDVAAATADGLVFGLAEGTTHVEVLHGGFSTDARIEVGDDSRPIVSVQLQPGEASLQLGGSLQLYLIGRYEDGASTNLTEDPDTRFSSSDESVLKVSATGLATALAVGEVVVLASFREFQAESLIGVSDEGNLVGIEISPRQAELNLGAELPLEVRAVYSDGRRRDVSAEASYFSSAPSVAQVDDTGLVRAAGAGQALVTTRYAGYSDVCDIRVSDRSLVTLSILNGDQRLAVPDQLQLQVEGLFDDGSSADLSSYTSGTRYSTSDERIAAVGPDGLISALRPGSALISAENSGQTDSIQVEVVGPEIVEIFFLPPSMLLEQGDLGLFDVWANYSDASSRMITEQASYSVSAPLIVDLPGPGLVQALAEGSAEVMAAYAGFTASMRIDVVPRQVLSFWIEPNFLEMRLGEQIPLEAWASFSDGSIEEVSAQTFWQSEDPTLVEVTGQGLVTAIDGGLALVQARFQGWDASCQILVVVGPQLIGIDLQPDSISMSPGDSAQMRVYAAYSDNTAEEVTELVLWELDEPGVISISQDGNLSGLAPGQAQLSARYEGFVDTSSVEVSGQTLIALRVVPGNVVLHVGEQATLRALADYDDGSSTDVSALASWSNSDPTVVLLLGQQLTALTAGTAFVSAAWQGFSDQSRIQVNAIVHPLPVLDSLEPEQVRLGVSGQELVAHGSGFDSSSVIRIDGMNMLTTFVDGGTLRCVLNDSTVSSFDRRQVAVFNPPPGGGLSNSLDLSVVDNPDIIAISPNSGMQGTELRVALYGYAFYGCSLSSSEAGIDISQVSISADGRYLFATLDIDPLAVVGPATLTVSNAAGSDSVSFRVMEDQPLENLTIASYDEVWLSGVQAYHNITINTGAIVHGFGDEPLQFLATGRVRIFGAIEVNGQRGEDGFFDPSAGGAAGPGGGGGGGGGDGDSPTPSVGGPGSPPGEDSSASQTGAGTPAGAGGGTGRGLGASGGYGQGGGGGGFGGEGGAGGGDAGDGTGAAGGQANEIGSDHNGGVGGGGGAGGGGVLVIACMGGDIEIRGALRADGGTGGSGYNSTGGGGGGSGGRIAITSAGGSILIEDTLSAQGGTGGRADAGDGGGGGGGGRIMVDAGGGGIDDSLGIYDVRGGQGGISRAGGHHGFTGDSGLVDFNY